jgi:hypothetical protein
MRWVAVGVALVLSAGGAAAQHVNDAQQMAYAKAFHGHWTTKNNRAIDFEAKNDGKEVRFTLAAPNPQLSQAGFRVNDVIYQGTFRGPEFKGWVLVAFGQDVGQRCNGTTRFWAPTSGKMNFDRNEIAIGTVAYSLVHHRSTGKCEILDKNDQHYAELTRNGQNVLTSANAVNAVLVRKN